MIDSMNKLNISRHQSIIQYQTSMKLQPVLDTEYGLSDWLTDIFIISEMHYIILTLSCCDNTVNEKATVSPH